jgi:hypothetical protein
MIPARCLGREPSPQFKQILREILHAPVTCSRIICQSKLEFPCQEHGSEDKIPHNW